MRILMLTDRFPPELRSAAHLFHDLARELQERGHEVAVVTKAPTHYVTGDSKDEGSRGWADVDGVRAYRARGVANSGRHHLLRALDHLAVGWTFRRAAVKWPGADVVLVYSPPLPLAQSALGYRRRFGAPVVLNVQDIYPQTVIDLGLLRNRAAIALAERMERRAYAGAAKIVVHSSGNRQFLAERKGVAPERVRVICNWIDVEGVRPGHRDNRFRVEHDLGDKYVVSYAGLMGHAQDLGAILRAAAVTGADDDILYLLVGEGVRESHWRDMVISADLHNVRFLPMQPRERYADLLAASDLCLVPLDASMSTPVVPGKLQSIMAAGRPAIAIVPRGGDAAKLIVESGGGVCVAPGDAESLASTIRRMKGDPSSTQSMGRRGRAFAEASFSLKRAADAYEEVFAEAVTLRSGGDACV